MREVDQVLLYIESFINTVHEPFVVLDNNLHVMTANKPFYDHFQLSPEETIGRLIFEPGNGKWNIPELKQLLERIIRNGGNIEGFELRPNFNNEGEKVLFINIRHIANENDNQGIILMAVEEITEYKMISESLRNEREKLKATIASIPDEFWITDAQGNIIERSVGSILDSLGKNDWPDIDTALKELELLNPDGTRRPPEDAALPRALRGEISRKVPEAIRNLKTGELRWREVSSSPILDKMGNITGAVAIARDITDRKRAEEELNKSEQRFRALATAGFSVVYHMSPDWGEMWQLSGSDFLADTTESNRGWLMGYIPEGEQSRVLSAIEEAIRNKSIFELEHQVIQADGSIGWTHSRAVPLIDSKGEISEWFGAARDITPRKKAEEELKRRTEELIFRNKELETFSYSVSHDLRNPLNAIKGLSEFLLADYAGILDERGNEILNHITTAANKMASIIEDLLSMARITRVQINCQKVDLNTIAASVTNQLHLFQPERKVHTEIVDSMPTYADPNLIEIALTNLIGNAWKYTGKNQTAHVDIGTKKIDNENVFFVRDNGVGFDMSQADQLFEPFHRLHPESQFSGIKQISWGEEIDFLTLLNERPETN